MSAGHKHCSRWGFGEVLYHKMTGNKGMVTAITLRHNSEPVYSMVFSDDVGEKGCLEIELTDEQPTAVEKA